MVVAIIGITTTGSCLNKELVGYVSYDFDVNTAITKLKAAHAEQRRFNPDMPLTVYQSQPLNKLV